ncbi:MAG: hypothetical protein ACRDLL_05815 [Solirubrobacterales bacterium]
MYDIGLALLAQAHRMGHFPLGIHELSAALAELDLHPNDVALSVAGTPGINKARSRFILELTPLDTGRIRLDCHYGNEGISTELRFNGTFTNEKFGVGLRTHDSDRAADSVAASTLATPDEQYALQRLAARHAERRLRIPPFSGKKYIRTLPLFPNLDAVISLLAVELYTDGLVGHYQYDRLHLHDCATASDSDNLEPLLFLVDDIGTHYWRRSATLDGSRFVRGVEYFAPAVPSAATTLTVSADGIKATIDVPQI